MVEKMESSALVVAVAVPEAVVVTAEEEITTTRDSAICSDSQQLQPKDKTVARLPTLSTLRSQVVPVEAATTEVVAETTVETRTSVAEVEDPTTDGKRPRPTRTELQTTTKM